MCLLCCSLEEADHTTCSYVGARLGCRAAGADGSPSTPTTNITMTDTKQAKTTSNGTSAPRGALIVVEGLDRSGKSTQLTKLVEALKEKGVSHKLMIHWAPATAADGIQLSSLILPGPVNMLPGSNAAAPALVALPGVDGLMHEGTS